MKLGSETNSVVNHIYSRAVIGQPEPQVGMGGTVLHWTDRDPVTIFRVFKVGKSVLIETRDADPRRSTIDFPQAISMARAAIAKATA